VNKNWLRFQRFVPQIPAFYFATFAVMPPPRVAFYTNGDHHQYGDSYIIINQNYVQYMPPEHGITTIDTPLLFIHGGGLTGSQWESTPDRRPGWAVRASEAGRHVYIMDGIDSGRSMRSPDGVRQNNVVYRSATETWHTFRFGEADDFKSRKPFPGSLFDPQHLDALITSQGARRRNTNEVERMGITNVVKELAVDGRIDIVAHSHGALLLVQATKEVAPMVRKAVLVEPGTTAASYMVEGMEALTVWGDYTQGSDMWRPIQAEFARGPYKSLVLPEIGINGNTHFPMSDRNSDEVFQLVHDWIMTK
jgi:pimeloyl-ACP methyl ester carboxylesterase